MADKPDSTPEPAAAKEPAQKIVDMIDTVRGAFAGVTVSDPESGTALGESVGAAMVNAVGPELLAKLQTVFMEFVADLPKLDASTVVIPAPEPEDIVNGLRFSHVVEMQTKQRLAEVSAELAALQNALIESGVVARDQLDAHAPAAQAAERARGADDVLVILNDVPDKYALTNLPIIDCEARLPLCKARCCTFTFALSTQDLDEREIRWDYGRPYQIARRGDGYCVHNEESGAAKHLCAVHGDRPASCRTYDCREDKRIWIDFDKRIPVRY